MAPVKFGDIAKVATEVLDDDYQVSGIQFKNKAKTSFNGAVVTTTVDVNPDDKIQTPSKLSWKFPNALGVSGLSVDKLEMDKGGKLKCEASMDKSLHKVKDLKLEVKSDLVSLDKVSVGATYSGIADTLLICESPALKPDAFSLDITRGFGPLTAGIKVGMASMTAPDLGCRYVSGPLFVSLLAKSKLSVFTAHSSYKVSDDIKVACFYEHSAKGNFGLGAEYKINKETSAKAKVLKNQDICCTVKYGLSKGFTVLFGMKFSVASGYQGWGLQVSLE
jgi:hypothetical protein